MALCDITTEKELPFMFKREWCSLITGKEEVGLHSAYRFLLFPLLWLSLFTYLSLSMVFLLCIVLTCYLVKQSVLRQLAIVLSVSLFMKPIVDAFR